MKQQYQMTIWSIKESLLSLLSFFDTVKCEKDSFNPKTNTSSDVDPMEEEAMN